MKKKLFYLLLTLCAALLLASCGGQPTESDAVKYTQAILDGICTGRYDRSVKFSDLDEGGLTKLRDEVLQSAVDSLDEETGVTFSQEVKDRYFRLFETAFSTCDYTVDGAEKADNGYDVTVTVLPLILYKQGDTLLRDAFDGVMAEPDKTDLSEDEVLNEVMLRIIDRAETDLRQPDYDSPVTLTVRYEELEKNTYGISEAGGEALGENLLSRRGMELGDAGPNAYNAKKTVQATLDIITRGSYDGSVDFVDLDPSEEAAFREDMIDEIVEGLAGSEGADAAVQQSYRDVFDKAFRQCRYKLGTVERAGEGYDVLVTVEPLDLTVDADALIQEKIAELAADPRIAQMTEADLMNELLQVYAGALKERVERPVYGAPVETRVRYEELEDGAYGVSEESGEQLGAVLFTFE